MNTTSSDIYEFFHNDDGSWTYKIDTFRETKPTLQECIDKVERIKAERGLSKGVCDDECIRQD